MFLIKSEKGNIEITQDALFGMITSHIDVSEIKDVNFLGFRNKNNINNSIKKGMSLLRKEKEVEENEHDITVELDFEVLKLIPLLDKGQEIQQIVEDCLHKVLSVDKEKVIVKVFFEKFDNLVEE